MKIEKITEHSVAVLEILRTLLPQLSRSAIAPTEAIARSIVESESSHLLVARQGDVIY